MYIFVYVYTILYDMISHFINAHLVEILHVFAGKVMLIAAVDKGRLILNYEQKLGLEQVVVAMAQSPKALVSRSLKVTV